MCSCDWSSDVCSSDLKKPTKKRNITITKVNPKTPVSQKSPSSPFHTPSATATSTAGTGGSKSVNPIVQQQKPTASAKQGAPIPYINGAVNPVGAHIHNHLMFLREPKDKQSRPVYSPDYDAHTLKVDFNELTQIDGKVLSKCDQFEYRVGRVEWCFSIHVEHFYTIESGEHAGKFSYLRASHVVNISHWETTRVEEYSVG